MLQKITYHNYINIMIHFCLTPSDNQEVGEVEIASLQHPGHGVHVESLDEHPEDHGEEEEVGDGRHHLTQHLHRSGDVGILLGNHHRFRGNLLLTTTMFYKIIMIVYTRRRRGGGG